MVKIDFLSVFEAKRGLTLLRTFNPDNPRWGQRDHQFGKLQYEITKEERDILLQNKVEFLDITMTCLYCGVDRETCGCDTL